MAPTPDDMITSVTESLAARTGRSLDEWLNVVRSSGIDPLDQGAVRKWLKAEHGVPQNSQWAIADAAARDAGWTRLTAAQYTDRNVQDVDHEVLQLLRAAYEQNAQQQRAEGES